MKRAALVVCLIVSVGWSGISGARRPSQSRTQIAVPTDPTSVGYLNLTKRHPDGADGPTEFATEYSPTTALQRVDQLRGFLDSFKQLTARARGTLTAADLRAAGNTSATIQTIGFHNIPLVVEGTLLKQDYQLKQVAYELARLRHLRGEVAEQDVERARVAYAEATNKFQMFWDTKRPTD